MEQPLAPVVGGMLVVLLLMVVRRRFGSAGKPGGTTPAVVAQDTTQDESTCVQSDNTKSVSRSKPSKPKTRRQAANEEEDRLASRPNLSVGDKCWHRQAEEIVEVVRVYYDDLPPYYSVRMADGSERATVRQRLDSLDERRALTADAERRQAEERAAAAAAALLAEEEKAEKRSKPKTTSEGAKGKSGKKKR